VAIADIDSAAALGAHAVAVEMDVTDQIRPPSTRPRPRRSAESGASRS
jgi:hypothetical protein